MTKMTSLYFVFQLTVEKLLSAPETNNHRHHTGQLFFHLTTYSEIHRHKKNKHILINIPIYTVGVSWSAAEKRSLVKSLQLHQKDFSSIQKTVSSY